MVPWPRAYKPRVPTAAGKAVAKAMHFLSGTASYEVKGLENGAPYLEVSGKADAGLHEIAELTTLAIQAESFGPAADTALAEFVEDTGVAIGKVSMSEDGLVYGGAKPSRKSNGGGKGTKYQLTIKLKNGQSYVRTGTMSAIGKEIGPIARDANLDVSHTDHTGAPYSWVRNIRDHERVPKWALEATLVEA